MSFFIPTQEHVAKAQTHLDVVARWGKSSVVEIADSVARKSRGVLQHENNLPDERAYLNASRQPRCGIDTLRGQVSVSS